MIPFKDGRGGLVYHPPEGLDLLIDAKRVRIDDPEIQRHC